MKHELNCKTVTIPLKDYEDFKSLISQLEAYSEYLQDENDILRHKRDYYYDKLTAYGYNPDASYTVGTCNCDTSGCSASDTYKKPALKVKPRKHKRTIANDLKPLFFFNFD